MDQTKRLEKLEKDFFKDWLHRNPILGTALGFHDDYDDMMSDGSLDKQLDDIKFLQRTLSEFEKYALRTIQLTLTYVRICSSVQPAAEPLLLVRKSASHR